MIGGVAAGLAEHLGWPVAWVRIGFLVAALFNGMGLLLYAAYWVLLPLGKPATATPAPADEAARPAREGADHLRRDPGLWPILAVGAIALGALFLIPQVAGRDASPIAVALIIAGAGAAIVWRQFDDAQRDRWRRAADDTVRVGTEGRASWWRLAAGTAMVLSGLTLLIIGATGPAEAAIGLIVGLTLTGGLAVLALPWARRQWEDLQGERARRARADERAEVAAHIHDSVLQTLTLIQKDASDPASVQRLARAEERRLRTWLYAPVGDPEQTIKAALAAQAARVESQYAADIDVVAVGDSPLTPQTNALIQAAGEAMVNAAKHAGGQVSVYLEAAPDEVSCFVRDRGDGFDPGAVPADRHGVRESIIGRMERNGGRAQVRSSSESGTEVRLFMPIDDDIRQERSGEQGGIDA